MKRTFLLLCLAVLLIGQTTFGSVTPISNQPDSVYLFSYATTKNSNTNGLHFAWSTDQKNWTSIGPEMRFLFCDYGRWGVEKRMITPFLFRAPDGMWHCVWSLNEHTGTFAHAESKDLIYWLPQTYPIVMKDNNCLEPEVSQKADGKYSITWLSTANGAKKAFGVTTSDFRTYSPAKEIALSDRLTQRKKILISGNTETGTVHKVAWEQVESLLNKQKLNAYRDQQWSETTKTDSLRFASLKTLDATITVDNSKSKKISDMMIGVFFEDINYAADGGLYAELLQNRDFEYAPSDKEGRDKTWNNTKAWHLTGGGATFSIDSVSPVHQNNFHYAILKSTEIGGGLVNEGFDGIAIKSGEKYDFSVFVRNPDKTSKKLLVRLIGKNGENYGETIVSTSSGDWKKQESILIAKQTAPDAQLEIIPQTTGTVALDMISLFPQKTFNGRKNGLRADLAQAISDIRPRFIRFPGGCVAHGDGLDNIYRWKNTVGPLESRKPMKNLWGYHQTVGLGYFEYFQFCEDIGAAPLPVIAAGVPCQNSATGGAGQQGGIPMCDMDDYVQDVLDLIEWANGDATTKWGKIRAEAGHPKPFNLKYIGIGNEDLINAVFEERFTMIFNAVKEKHPEITVIGTVGPSFEGTDYVEGWKIATKLHVPMVDEHYYQSPGWFIHNQDYYDKYDRSKPKVYLGEYASHLPGRVTNMETALSEALYLTACERNGDVVSMTSYAPLLAKEGHTQWNPDLIYFNNSEVKPTVDYFVQQLYGQNSGDTYLTSDVRISDKNDAVRKRVAISVVRDSKNNDLIVKLVNMLPVSVKTNVILNGVDEIRSQATRIVLTGLPTDKNARPVTDQIAVSGEFPYSMPPYSFTVIRINPEKRPAEPKSGLLKKQNVYFQTEAKKIYLPVKRGTNLSQFNPEFKAMEGVSISPSGVQNFAKGPVNYTFKSGQGKEIYQVTASEDHNPVLEGFYADPEILYSEKTGKYYLYPTSDGFYNWSGDFFKVFSSENLVDWKDEGVILDLKKDVSWANRNAWAPCIVEKKINGQYKYFYYFTAAQKIGVAVADNPTGPFVDSGKALIDHFPEGIKNGQQIDPDVFTDPVSGKSYLYWGNGYMAGVELNDDMISLNEKTLKIMTPDNTFREGSYVIYRNGTYYFMWSEDDTRSPNYKVRYATAQSPLGKLTIPEKNVVITQNPEQEIFATGHNSVLQIPGKDEWYLVYHRFTRPKGIKMGSPAGFNREVCIDKLEFNADGSIKQVIPTLQGIKSISK